MRDWLRRAEKRLSRRLGLFHSHGVVSGITLLVKILQNGRVFTCQHGSAPVVVSMRTNSVAIAYYGLAELLGPLTVETDIEANLVPRTDPLEICWFPRSQNGVEARSPPGPF